MDSVTQALMEEFATANSLVDLPKDKKFEYFAAYCLVSSRYNEEFDVQDLIAGDGADLNVDAFAVKVNGRLADDADFIKDVIDLNGYLDVEFIIVQAKTSSNFDGAAIIALGDNLAKQVFADVQTMPVNEDVKRLIEIKDAIFHNASKLKENPVCRVYYACTGNWNEDQYLVEALKAKRNDLINTNLFSEVYFEPVGARSLQKMFRETRTSIAKEITFEKLVTLPSINGVTASYLGVLPHGEFLKLISDDGGELIKSVFVDNVRDFQGVNEVNKDIAKTITDGMFDQFVLRNNGITIVARSIKVTSSKFTLVDYQIVNGCQTSHVLFANKNAIKDELFVPVKLIHTENEEVSQSVIKSTNKQTPVEENDLLALTQFQRDLEDFYNGQPDDYRLFYERRAKQYAGQAGIEKGRITTVGSQLKSFSSMFLDYPHQASRYQGTLLKTVNKQVFQANHKPEPYFTAALGLYRFETFGRRLSPSDRTLASFRYYVLMAFRYRYEPSDFLGAGNKKVANYCAPLIKILSNVDEAKLAFDEACAIVLKALDNLNLQLERDNAKSRSLVDEVKKVARDGNPVVKQDDAGSLF
ncbi:AIPR family protein [Agrobacterium salinitolerans]|uniref:AIPR family protein n=1 Tax=Agrobacterium salinitolerans TaxID=1183413 RepID=UPI0022B8AA93|nr:AIPR family protein [Agrobacterium salinitolerans]MCZ7854248.1 AIPR family protein [Agrobacterium salinitolerans]